MQERYFIAVVPPEPLQAELMGLKQGFYEDYATKGALRSPAHITLHMPFLYKLKKEQFLIDKLKSFCSKLSPFEINLNGFGAFAPRVIFVAVDENHELGQIQSDLSRYCRRDLNLMHSDYKDRGFHPHLTVAFRDLKKPAFAEAWAKYEALEYHARFDVNHICLLKHHGKRWEILERLPFKNETLKLPSG